TGDREAFKKLSEAAELWRTDGNHFSAGVAMASAVDAAWGDPELMYEALTVSVSDFEKVLSTTEKTEQAWVAAATKLIQVLSRLFHYFSSDREASQARIEEIRSELGSQLVSHFSDDINADNYLVTGFIVTTDFDGKWSVTFPEFPPQFDVEQGGSQLQ